MDTTSPSHSLPPPLYERTFTLVPAARRAASFSLKKASTQRSSQFTSCSIEPWRATASPLLASRLQLALQHFDFRVHRRDLLFQQALTRREVGDRLIQLLAARDRVGQAARTLDLHTLARGGQHHLGALRGLLRGAVRGAGL